MGNEHRFWFDEELQERRRRGLYRQRRRLHSGQGPRVRWRGRDLVNFASNDYLNLASDPRLARAAARAARRYGCGAGASPLVTGHLPPLRALERDLAAWQLTEEALVFSSGYAANLAVLGALAGREDAIFSDAFNHASLIDGCRLSRARIHIYEHANLAHLHDLLGSHGASARRRFIVTDTVFSMDGDLAPLPELVALAEEFDALVVIDEAHATGVLGEDGRGVTSLWSDPPLARERVVKVGTLSKALGAQGGFVCGSRSLIRWLVNHARPYIFSTALAPPLAAAARQAIAIVRGEAQARQQLQSLGQQLRRGLWSRGYDLGVSTSHIVPLLVGQPQATLALSRRLEARGLLVPAIRPPSVPEGTSRLRISLTAGHTTEEVDRLLAALSEGR